MRVGLFLDVTGRRVWHRWLAEDLGQWQHELVVLQASERERPLPATLRLAFGVDQRLYRLHGEHAFDPIAAGDPSPVTCSGDGASARFDVLVDCGGGAEPLPAADRVLRVSFNGMPGELGAIGALLGDQPLTVEIEDAGSGRVERARPGIERRSCLTGSVDDLFASVVELLAERIAVPRTAGIETVADAAGGDAASSFPIAARRSDTARLAVGHVVNLVLAKLERLLAGRPVSRNAWAIAMRRSGNGGLASASWPSRADYDVIADDGQRYYADPFLFSHGGRTFLFCEEYPFATGRGLISVAEIDEDGRASAFRPVLERPYHLSYPFVFAHDGDIWMMPEAGQSGNIELYRAVEFPDRWALDRTLIAGVGGCDATIVAHGGLYWMFLTAAHRRSMTWDKLRIYRSASPIAGWSEHEGGLITVDSTMARPAGAAQSRKGALLRPTQNCSRIYGGSMTLVETMRLSADSYRERAVAEIVVRSASGLTGTHTLSYANGFEAVDVFGTINGASVVTLDCRPLAPATTIAAHEKKDNEVYS